MRYPRALIPTPKEAPADVTSVSHVLSLGYSLAPNEVSELVQALSASSASKAA